MRTATIRVQTAQADKLLAALQPEVARPTPRTRVTLEAAEHVFRLEISAQDTPALRAALNSYLRWTATALEMVEEAT